MTVLKGAIIPIRKCQLDSTKLVIVNRSEIPGFTFGTLHCDKGDVGLILDDGQYKIVFYLSQTDEEGGRVIGWRLRTVNPKSSWADWTMVVNNDIYHAQ